jgi:hypothetical protein
VREIPLTPLLLLAFVDHIIFGGTFILLELLPLLLVLLLLLPCSLWRIKYCASHNIGFISGVDSDIGGIVVEVEVAEVGGADELCATASCVCCACWTTRNNCSSAGTSTGNTLLER